MPSSDEETHRQRLVESEGDSVNTTPSSVAARPRILLVEDNRNQADALAAILGDGLEVVRAIDGREARARLATGEAFDAVLSDVEMPRMGGFALLQWLRSERPELAVRLVFVTVDPETSLARTLAQTHPILRKPVKPEELHAAVQAALRKR